MENFLNGVLCYFRQILSVIDVDPGIRISLRVVELAKVDGDVQLAVVKAEITVMVDDRYFVEQFPVVVSFDQLRCERPVNGFTVGADSLQVMLIRSFALDALREMSVAGRDVQNGRSRPDPAQRSSGIVLLKTLADRIVNSRRRPGVVVVVNS